MLECLVQDVLAHRDRGASEYRIHMDGAVIPHIFAERSFRLKVAAFVEISFYDDLRISWNQNIISEAADEGRGFPT